MEGLKRNSYLAGILFFTLFGSSCARSFEYQLSSSIKKSPSENPQENVKFLEGSLQTTEGKTIELRNEVDKPLVVVFAQDTCGVCYEETEEFRASLKFPDQDPTKTKIITILVGAYLEDAQFWKDSVSVPWDVTINRNDQLFHELCPEKKVPCTAVQLPNQGLIFQKTGAVHSDEIKKLTGQWEEE